MAQRHRRRPADSRETWRPTRVGYGDTEKKMGLTDVQKTIISGKSVLGVEFGSTRIKAVLIDEDHTPIAAGSYEWENRFENGVWTYHLEDVWIGLQESYRDLSNEVLAKYGVPLQTIGTIGFSGMMHG